MNEFRRTQHLSMKGIVEVLIRFESNLEHDKCIYSTSMIALTYVMVGSEQMTEGHLLYHRLARLLVDNDQLPNYVLSKLDHKTNYQIYSTDFDAISKALGYLINLVTNDLSKSYAKAIYSFLSATHRFILSIVFGSLTDAHRYTFWLQADIMED